MSGYREYRGGGRGRGRGGPPRDYGHPYSRGGPSSLPSRPVPVVENYSVSAMKTIIKLADGETFDTQEDLPSLARYITKHWIAARNGVFEGFKIGISENPHKLPYYAALLLILSRDEHIPSPTPVQPGNSKAPAAIPTDTLRDGDVDMVAVDSLVEGLVKDENGGGEPQEQERIHLQVLKHLGKCLEQWLEEREWLKVRLMMSFFANLLPLNLVSQSSFLSVLSSLTATIRVIAEENHFDLASVDGRADRLVRIVTDSLLRVGPLFFESNEDAVNNLVEDIKTYVHARANAIQRDGRGLCNAVARIGTVEKDNIDYCVDVLQEHANGGYLPPWFIPAPSKRFPLPEGEELPQQWDMPSISVPERRENALGRVENGEGMVGSIYSLDNAGVTDGRVPDASTPKGWWMRTLMIDIIEIYEVNRIECAALLMRVPDFVLPDTFSEPPPRPPPGEAAPLPHGEWTRPSTIINVVVSSMLSLPYSSHKLVYYVGLIAQLCLLEKMEMAPPLGLAFKTLYARLGKGLDVEISNRTAEWLALHLSNFAFTWLWKEWVPDLVRADAHPKKAFMKRVIDQEIRLSYHDRILSTLPDQFSDVDGIISPEPLEEDYKFRSSSVPNAANAQELLDMVRRRDHAEDVLDRLRQMAETTVDQPIPPSFCEVATHVLLELGKGAFAHHLRVLERYLPVFKALALTSEDRQQLLASSVDYWKHNIQQQIIVFGKYHFYQILDASDIVTFVFSRLIPSEDDISAGRETAWTNVHAWDLLNVALEQQYGFAIGSNRKKVKLGREDEEARARKKELDGGEGDGMVVDSKPSEQLATAQRNADRLRHELDSLLVHTFSCFVKSLLPSYYVGEEMTLCPSKMEEMVALDGGNETIREQTVWDTRSRFGWFKQFLRVYAKPLKLLSTRIEEILEPLPYLNDAMIDKSDARVQAGFAVRQSWAQATGGKLDRD